MAVGTSDGQHYPSEMDYQIAQTSGPEYRIDDQGNHPFIIPSPSPPSANPGFKQKMDRIQEHDRQDIEQQNNDPNYIPLPEVPLRINPGTPSGFQSGRVISDNSKDVHIIRHGSTDYNSDEKVRSWSNVPLNEEGKQESKQVADKLADSGIQVLFHSDLDRAADTAKDIAKKTGAELVPMKDFRSWHAGELTGQHYSDANPMMKDHAINKPDEPLPGGESFNQFKQRVQLGVAKAEAYANGRETGIVTHRGVERLLNAQLKGSEQEPHMPTFFAEGENTGSHQKLPLFQEPTPQEKWQSLDPREKSRALSHNNLEFFAGPNYKTEDDIADEIRKRGIVRTPLTNKSFDGEEVDTKANPDLDDSLFQKFLKHLPDDIERLDPEEFGGNHPLNTIILRMKKTPVS